MRVCALETLVDFYRWDRFEEIVIRSAMGAIRYPENG